MESELTCHESGVGYLLCVLFSHMVRSLIETRRERMPGIMTQGFITARNSDSRSCTKDGSAANIPSAAFFATDEDSKNDQSH
jgi:hypothetical protein